MEQVTIKNQNAMPAPTWGWLRMNSCDIPVPAGLARGCDVDIDAPDALLNTAASFEGAVAALQERLDAERAAAGAADDGRAVVRAANGKDRGAEDLDTPALSTYERNAVRSEVASDVAADFQTGVGTDARAYLNMLAGETVVLAGNEGTTEHAAVRVTGEAGLAGAVSLDVIAAPDSALALDLLLDGENEAMASADANDTASAPQPGLIGSTLRVFAGARSRVDVTVYLTCDPGFTAIEDSGFVLDEDARVTVRHVVLGGELTVTGLAADLRGNRSQIDIDTRYLALGDEQRDFNYIIRHRGRETQSDMDANGVLAGTAKKTLRGTIDLIHGCKGSQGNERETVLLASKGVDNKTVPVILCDEDDVAGNHGATIGHVRPDQLFYAACRGLSQEATEALFLQAKLEDAAIAAPDEQTRAAVLRVAQRLVPGLEEEIA